MYVYILIFLTKCALDFAAKLNSRDIQNCNCFWIRSYSLFSSACKAIGSFSNDDGDGNDNGRKAMGLMIKTTSLHAFLYIFFAITARPQGENA